MKKAWKSLKKQFKSFISKHPMRPFWIAAIIANSCDVLSSMLPFPAGFEEQNPFARHPENHMFWPYHGIVLKLVFLAYYFILTGLVFNALEKTSKEWATAIAGSLLIYAIVLGPMEAAINNFFNHMGWYVPSQSVFVLLVR